MKKMLLYFCSLQALFVLYVPIYAMFRYHLSWSDIGLYTLSLFALFWELKNIIGIRFVNDLHEWGFEIVTDEDD